LASLKLRFVLVTAIILALFALSAGWILRQSFDAAMHDRALEQLKLHVYSLLSAAEFSKGKLELPLALAEPRFNQLQSGLFAAVISGDKAVWHSQSYLGTGRLAARYSVPGDWAFDEFNDGDQHFYRIMFTVIWEHKKKETPFTFVVWESSQPYQAQIRGFESTLWYWLGGLILASIAVTFGLLYLGFRPFTALAQEVGAIESGERDAIRGKYPAEVVPVVVNLNRLLEHERTLRERYKNSLGDLAHSLKTPLAVVRGLDFADLKKSQPLLQQQIARMDDIISYQLRRALSTAPALAAQGAPVQELVQKLGAALRKVYADKSLQIETSLADGIRIPCDEGDGFELCGNLLDNACKHGGSHIRISATTDQHFFYLTVEDNGEGIPGPDRALILQRGVRRDERAPGQGIGLAVVVDIVTAYGGELQIDQSSLGGACFRVRLPR
jgi:two-component system sensor histidine kinase PhoQ